jgi:hypothetical protein
LRWFCVGFALILLKRKKKLCVGFAKGFCVGFAQVFALVLRKNSIGEEFESQKNYDWAENHNNSVSNVF